MSNNITQITETLISDFNRVIISYVTIGLIYDIYNLGISKISKQIFDLIIIPTKLFGWINRNNQIDTIIPISNKINIQLNKPQLELLLNNKQHNCNNYYYLNNRF